MSRSPLAERIGQRLAELGYLPDGITPAMCRLQRTRAGHWQRSEGAWSWYLRYVNETGREIHGPEIGSQYPATEVLRWSEWNIYRGSIDPKPAA